MTTTDTDIAPGQRALLKMPLEKFKRIVDRDVRPPMVEVDGRKRLAGRSDAPEWHAFHDALRSPAVADRWFMALNQILKSIDGQLAAKTEDYEAERATLRALLLSPDGPAPVELTGGDGKVDTAKVQAALERLKADYARSRAGTLRFKTGVDEVFIEARAFRDSVRDSLYDSVVAEERNRYAARVTVLETAIRAHRDATTEADLDPEPHDLHLWAVIE